MAYKLQQIVLISCLLIVIGSTTTLYNIDDYSFVIMHGVDSTPLSRQVRSPDGSIVVEAKKDASGRSASVDYNQNVYKSKDGNFEIDAYGRAARDFDRHRNDYGGGVRGSWRF